MLDKWDYSCNQNLSYKKSFASTKLWNKIKLHINLYIMGCPFSMYTIISMYTEILSYSRATNICWMENPDDKRAFSSSLLRKPSKHLLVLKKLILDLWKYIAKIFGRKRLRIIPWTKRCILIFILGLNKDVKELSCMSHNASFCSFL